jgi:hypothetical protein
MPPILLPSDRLDQLSQYEICNLSAKLGQHCPAAEFLFAEIFIFSMIAAGSSKRLPRPLSCPVVLSRSRVTGGLTAVSR